MNVTIQTNIEICFWLKVEKTRASLHKNVEELKLTRNPDDKLIKCVEENKAELRMLWEEDRDRVWTLRHSLR